MRSTTSATIMKSQPANQKHQPKNQNIPFWTLIGSLVVICSGCQQFPWPGSQQAKQFQVDSERILGEFRAQKKRADELAAKNQQLEARLAQTEKSLARQNLQSLSQSNSSSSRNNRRGTANDNSQNNRMFVGPPDDDPGLPDTPPSMAGLLTSGAGFSRVDRDRDTAATDKDAPQWRPVRRK